MPETQPVAGSLEEFKQAEEARTAPRVSGPRAAPRSAPRAATEEEFRGYQGSRSTSPTITSTLMAPVVGANIGVAEALGMPVDVVQSALNVVLPESLQIRQPLGGSESIMTGMGYLGADPRTVPPRSTLEHYLQSAGRGAGSAAALMMGPAGAARAGLEAALPRTVEIAKKVLGEYRSGAAPVANIAAGAGAETATEATRRIAPETSEYAPIIPMLAGMAGGVATGAAGEAVRQAGRGLASYFEPMFERGRQALVARGLLGSSEKPEALLARLHGAETFVPGAPPTTGQIDRGLAELERVFAGRYPDFAQRYAQQNEVRAEALNNIQRSGNPADLSAFIRREFEALDTLGEEEVKAAVAQATRRASEIGGELNPEEYGKLIRDTLQENKQAARMRRNALYDAIDPNKELNVVAEPIRADVDNFYRNLSPQEMPPAGEEANILRNISELPDVMRFADLTALDTRITEAMRAEKATSGESRIYQRLIEMKNAVQGAMFNAAENQANFERRALEQGQLPPESAMEARLRAAWGLQEPPPDQLTPNLSQDAVDRLQRAKEAHQKYVQTFRQGPIGDVLRGTGFADNYRLLDSNVANQFFRPGVEGFERAQAFKTAVGDNEQALNLMQDYAASSLRRAAENADGSIDPAKLASWLDRHQDALRAFPDLAARFSDAGTASEAVAQAMSNRVRATTDYQKGLLGRNFMNLTEGEDVTKTVGAIFNRRDAVRQFNELSSAARQNPDAFSGLRRAAADFIVNKFISPSFGPEGGEVNARQFVQFLSKNLPSLRTMFNDAEINGMMKIAADLQRASRVTPSGERQFAPEARTILAAISNQPEQGLMRQIGRGISNILPLGAFGGLGFWTLGPVGAAVFAGADAILMRARSAGLEKTADLMRAALLNPELAAQLVRQLPPPGSQEERSFIQNTIGQLARSGVQAAAGEDRENRREPQGARFAGGRVGRKSGGRLVRNDHAARAAALIRAAEAAKKAHNKTTEDILEQPDEAVAKALSIANKAI